MSILERGFDKVVEVAVNSTIGAVKYAAIGTVQGAVLGSIIPGLGSVTGASIGFFNGFIYGLTQGHLLVGEIDPNDDSSSD